jgi:hypothetical protein
MNDIPWHTQAQRSVIAFPRCNPEINAQGDLPLTDKMPPLTGWSADDKLLAQVKE